jgi:hypothetical protein
MEEESLPKMETLELQARSCVSTVETQAPDYALYSYLSLLARDVCSRTW